MIFRFLYNAGRRIPPVNWGFRKFLPWLTFFRDFTTFRTLLSQTKPRFSLRWKDRSPCLHENTTKTKFDGTYIYHTAWAARVLAKTKPDHHVDISSALFFSTLVSAFVPVKFYDYRPAHITLSQLTSQHADLLALPFADGEVTSLSCMHVVEHIGLGRYGDPIDPQGDLKAIAELKRVLAPGGVLLFVSPIGQPKIMFNAHRIYSYQQILEYFHGLRLREFSLLPDKDYYRRTDPRNATVNTDAQAYGLIANATQEMADAQTLGCGCFWFEKE